MYLRSEPISSEIWSNDVETLLRFVYFFVLFTACDYTLVYSGGSKMVLRVRWEHKEIVCSFFNFIAVGTNIIVGTPRGPANWNVQTLNLCCYYDYFSFFIASIGHVTIGLTTFDNLMDV